MRCLKRKIGRYIFGFLRNDSGQSITEFALLLPVLLLLVFTPVDYFLYIRMKMILNDAASQSVSELEYDTMDSLNVENWIQTNYGDKLNMEKLEISMSVTGENHPYTYYVYDSELASLNPGDYSKQFDARAAEYNSKNIKLKLTYEMKAVTFFGVQFLGDHYKVETAEYSRDVFAN